MLIAPGLVAESGTLAAGVIVLGGAVEGMRTFCAALSDGDALLITLQDPAKAQSMHIATLASGPRTLTLGSALLSAGIVADGPVVVWASGTVGQGAPAVDDPGIPGEIRYSGVYRFECYINQSGQIRWSRAAVETSY
jgi:hypothetical protein